MHEVVAGIKARLVAASVTGAANTFLSQAPSGISSPYILVEHIGGGEMNNVSGDWRVETWQVGVYTQDKDHSAAATSARTIMAALKTALHGQQASITISGWTCNVFWHTEPFWIPDMVAGEPAYYAGGRYTVVLFSSS